MDLVDIGNGFKLDRKAALSWAQLVKEAGAAGHEIHISTAWRSSEQQKALYARYVRAVADWKRKGSSGPKPTPVAVPGKSMHERGLAVDIRVAAYPKLLLWLKLNCERLGWKHPLPSEPWHFECLSTPVSPPLSAS